MTLRRQWNLSPPEQRQRLQADLERLVSAMSPEAQRLFMDEMLPEMAESQSPTLDAIYELEYRWNPVSIEEFVNSEDYCGSILRGNLFPRIIDDLTELFTNEFNEVVLKGSIGWGKTSMAYTGIAYDIYLVSCLKNPADAFGLLPGSNVAFINVSVKGTRAKKDLFGGVLNLIRHSPYFRERFPFDPKIQTELRFPNGVYAYPVVTTETALLGEGVFSAAFDEINFYEIVEKSTRGLQGGVFDQAVQLYNRLSRRIKSRMNQRGRLPGHLWMVSSAKYPTDFTERKAAEAVTDKSIFVRDYATWDTRPKHYFMSKNFRVEIGDATKRTRILKGDETDVNEDRVMQVPMEFYNDFDKDPDGAARDMAGISVLATNPYIGNRSSVAMMFKLGEDNGLKHPFTVMEATLQADGEYFIPENLHWIEKKTEDNSRSVMGSNKVVVVKLIHPGPYYAHVDLAIKNDACGFGVVHQVGWAFVKRLGDQLKEVVERRPVIRVDLLLRIVAPPHGEIQISSVRGLFYKLAALKIHFGKITYDAWGSIETLQILQSQGYLAEHFSLDTDMAGYESLKTAMYDQRVLCYYQPTLERELLALEKDNKKGKVDHPPGGGKDLADALAGAVYNCEQAANFGEVQAFAPKQAEAGPDKKRENEDLWAKLEAGQPLTEEEFDRL
jgi:hypothetical protein